MNCKYCNKPLRAIGYSRKNGANHKDWGSREFHKKCWKSLKDKQSFIFSLYGDDDERLFKQIAVFKETYNLEKLL